MTDTNNPPKLKIYPSSSGFITDRGVEVEYESGCLRYMVASIGTVRVPLDPIYETLGAIHEDWYATQLGDNLAEREREIRVDLSEEVQYSGRADFITKDGHIHETKATLSSGVLYQNIRKKKVKLGHLAQLTSYMIRLQQTRGHIILGYYRETTLDLQEYVVFDVEIQKDGRLVVNGDPVPYMVQDQLRYLNTAQKVLETKEIGPRPHNYTEWSGPCKRCPLNNTCQAYDNSILSDKDYIERAKEILNAQQPRLRKDPRSNRRSPSKSRKKSSND